MTLAHPGQPVAPHDVWAAWNADPVLIGGLLVAVWLYRRGQTPGRSGTLEVWRARCFIIALAVVGVALVSPLEALSSALAAAHMVQHLLLVLVVAPLLAISAPWTMLLRGSPPAVRRASGRWRRRLGLSRRRLRALQHPAGVSLLHVGTLWFWHASVPYGAALQHEAVHVLEHASFLITATLFWHVIVSAHRYGRIAPGLGVLLAFAMSMQSVFLSLLLTFAGTPWYAGYATTTTAWGLDPLADQQLAGVIMWIPAGLVYLGAALILLAGWIRRSDMVEASRPP